jgi:tetratricopeptide (TPR) repeat protein
MKQPDQALFLLIQALSQSEKRYFKLVAAPHSVNRANNKYLLLFDRIEKQKQYDEVAIKKYFAKDSFLGKHLKTAKSHLYNLILSTLERYHHDEDAIVHGQIHQARILFRKGLSDQAGKMVAKAKKNALKNEYFTALLEIAEQERNLMAYKYVFEKNKVDKLFREAETQVRKLENYLQVLEAEIKISMHFEKHLVIRNASERKKIVALGQELLIKKEKPLSSKAAGVFYNSMGSYYLRLELFEEAQESYKKALFFCPATDEKSLVKFAILTTNYIEAASRAKKYSTVSKEVKKLFEVCEKYPGNLRLKLVQQNLCHTVMLMHIDSGLFQKGIAFMESVRNRFFTNVDARNKIFFTINSAVLYLGNGNYRQSLQQINTVLNTPESENPLPDTLFWSKILQLLLLLEMKDYDMLGYRIKSFYRYVLKRKKLQKSEQLIFEFIRKNYSKNEFLSSRPKTVRQNILHSFLELKKQLVLFQKKEHLSGMPEYFDFISWLESKIQNRPFAEIMHDKSIQR